MEETYSILYQAQTQDAKTAILGLASVVAALDNEVGASVKSLKGMGTAGASLKGIVSGLAAAIDGLKERKAAVLDVGVGVDAVADSLRVARDESLRLRQAIDGLRDSGRPINQLANDAARVGTNAQRAAGDVGQLAAAATRLGGQATQVGAFKDAVVGVQRAGYGARKNMEELGTAVGKLNPGSLGGMASSLQSAATQARGLRLAMGQANGRATRLGSSLTMLATRMMALQGIRQAIEGAGEAFSKARESADEGALKNLSVRDRYRELANLQGRPSPDDGVVANALRLRMQTGLNDSEVNKALRRFEGSLPAGRDKGNITGSSGEGLARDVLVAGLQLGERSGMDAGTAGDLAASLANYGKITSVDQAAGQMGTIVDLLNRGRGDMTPLVNAMMKNAGNLVGPGAPLKSLGQFAALESVASLNATPDQAGTRVQQAMRELYGFSKSQGDALRAYGLSPEGDARTNLNQFFDVMANVERNKPGINLENWMANAGFRNSQGRQSIVQLYRNRGLVNQLMDQADAGEKTGPDVLALNRRFMATDTAQARVGDATKDAAEFAQFRAGEKLAIGRKQAEASLRANGQVDTAASNFADYMADLAPTRIGSAAVDYLTGRPRNDETLPIFLGGKSTRQLRIDKEAEDRLNAAALRSGFDPRVRFPALYAPGSEATREERFSTIAGEVQRRGGNPFANGPNSGQVDAQLRELIREVRRGNDLQQQALQQKAGQVPPMMPPGGPNRIGRRP